MASSWGYASRHGQALIDRALYPPREWTWWTPRRSQARIPETVKFTTKPKQGLAKLERARVAGLLCAWITGDSVYGAVHIVFWDYLDSHLRVPGHDLIPSLQQQLRCSGQPA